MANKYTALKVPDKKLLEELYFKEFMNQKEIGELFNTTQRVVFTWFRKLGIKSRVAAKRDQWGKNNHAWKGEKAKYAAIHDRIYRIRGKANKCEVCGRSDPNISYDWANQTGNYWDINDFKMMCRSCHFKKDGIKANFPNNDLIPNINISKLINGKL